MRLLLGIYFTCTLAATTLLQAEGTYVPKPLPAHLEECVDKALSGLALSDGSRKTVEKLFERYVDRDGLGARSWGRAWRVETDAWRATAIKLYIDTLMLAATDAKDGATVVETSSRLADYPERGANTGKGVWQIAFSVTLSTGRVVSAGALINDSCKALDFIHGDWISRTVPHAMVDLAM